MMQSTPQIPGYHILRELGRGGMATVYLATQLETRRPVALKLMHPHLSSEHSLRKRFAAEAAALAQLDHPNIVRIFDSGSVESTLFIAMQYVEGGKTLREALPLKGSIAQILHLLRQISSGLAHAHGRGIVHRDIKPSNILLDGNNQPLIADFGVVKILEAESTDLTQTGYAVGTPKYMSPEQALGIDTDARSDLYSLGIIFYQLLTGQEPYHSSFDHLHAPTPPIPPQLAAYQVVIDQLLAKDPDDRLASAEALIKLIDGLAELPINLSVPIRPPAAAQPSGDPGSPFNSAMAYFFSRNKNSDASQVLDLLVGSKQRPLERDTYSRPLQKLGSICHFIHQYWGFEIPVRYFHLDFNLPALGQRMEIETQPNKLRKILDKALKSDITNLLKKMENYLRSLSHQKIGIKRRQTLLEIITEALFPKIIYIKERFQRDGCIPERESRAQHLDGAIRFIQALVVNYQIIFQHDYNLSSWRYRFTRKRLHVTAFRIMELCLTEQQLRALRYQPLDENSWRICNAIFWIMMNYERVDRPYNLLTVQGIRFEVQATLLQLFSEIHLMALWRHLSWPTHYLPVITVYLRQTIEPVKLYLYEKTHSDDGLWYIAPRQGRVAQLSHPQGDYPPLVLDINRLHRRIQHDLDQLDQGGPIKPLGSNTPLPLRGINPEDHHWLLNNMLTSLNRNPAKILTVPLAPSQQSWCLFVGLERILNFLLVTNDYSGDDWDCDEQSVNLEINLAQRSAPQNDGKGDDSFWHHLGSDDNEFAFQTLESPLTYPIAIGTPVIFFPYGEPQRKRLGFVSLIQRIERKHFVVVITRHGNQLRSVRVSPSVVSNRQNEKSLCWGLLIDRGKDKPKDLLLPPSDAFMTGHAITVIYSQRRVPKLLGARWGMGGQNHLYTLQSVRAKTASLRPTRGRVTHP